ncbi:chromosome segregation protein SMC [Rhodovulum sp. DZ06]|uniref:chromosome segregation protein SMC n=1 Tax=Rhodovulum sp. DZ06 TaxID=3425126 RepID=UPI003D332F9C
MQFVKLRLQGFKSFVDPTELVIEPGLTGVVGPNGCGKSNLLEALRWVMGETSAKAMRGAGMEDVIFAGAASRPAKRFAEVALHLDDRTHQAPPVFPTSDSIEIVRRITREAGSAYRANGKEVRARDVKMLFADAATGAHSPALVRQGMISELVNARPKARRAILEEAAGIGGLYQRRHEAELKLGQSEQNLERVTDVIEQLDGQLGALARQARQAAKYREIASELRRAESMLLWLRWREAASEAEAARAALEEAAAAASRAQAATQETAAAREAAEEALPDLREEDGIARAVIQKLLAERERVEERDRQAHADIQRLEGRINQLNKDLEREGSLNRDADEMQEQLDWEETQLRDAHAGHDARKALAEEAAREAGEILRDREAAVDRLSADYARLQARRQSVERRVSETETAAERAAAEAARTEAQVDALVGEIAAAETTLARAEEEAEEAEIYSAATEDALAAAEAERAAAQAAESEGRAARAAAQGEARALRAEADALRKLLDRDRSAAGQLLDQVRAEPGYEAALGAALGDDLRARELKDGESGATGWSALGALPGPGDWPAGAAPLSDHVDAPAALARRLARTAVIDRAAGDAAQAALGPGMRLVSRDGDLWRWDGFRVSAEDAPSAAALRLQQKNRLDALDEQLYEAEAAEEAAAEAHEEAKATLSAATDAETQARAARRDADRRQTETQRARARADSELDLRRGRLEAQRHALDARREEAAAARGALEEARRAVDDLEDLGEAQARLEESRHALAESRQGLMSARSHADEIRREGEARARRLSDIGKERAGWLKRQESAAARLSDLQGRIERSEDELTVAREAPETLARERDALVGRIAQGEIRAREAGEALSAAEAALRAADAAARDAEREASARREARARAEAVNEAAAARAAEAAQRVEEETGAGPDALADTLKVTGEEAETPPTLQATELSIIDLRRRRDAMGAVNLRAEEDAAEVQAERDELASEKDDLEEAIARLRKGVAELNSEGRARLLAAFEEVKGSFATLFTHLFGGGEASLELVESDDPLDAGLEIMAMPPGKRLTSLSLMSGGEQTLTALSLIFAVFLANPAPICVLDEVDAPLDDANVTRFCDLLDEMTRRTSTRFLIITHHALTMSRMDRLFGVTMQEQGVSQLVSVDLRRAAEMVEG